MTIGENKTLKGGQGIFCLLPIIGLTKTRLYPQHPIALENYQKIEKSILWRRKNIYMLIILYMPPSEDIYFEWWFCNFSYRAGICLGKFNKFWLFMIILGQNQQNYPCIETELTQPPTKLHSFRRWHMKYNEHLYLFHKINFKIVWYFLSAAWGWG